MMMLLYILLAIAYIPSITLLILFIADGLLSEIKMETFFLILLLLIPGINLYITIEFFRNIITNS